MKKKDVKKELQEAIDEKKCQLDKLNAHVDKSKICSDLYNKVVLEKAIMNKELQDLEKNMIVEKVKKIIPKKKTMICDYFKN